MRCPTVVVSPPGEAWKGPDSLRAVIGKPLAPNPRRGVESEEGQWAIDDVLTKETVSARILRQSQRLAGEKLKKLLGLHPFLQSVNSVGLKWSTGGGVRVDVLIIALQDLGIKVFCHV